MVDTLKKHDIDLVVLAGYLVIVPVKMIHEYRNRIINIHPSLIPSHCGMGYYGLKVHESVLATGNKVTGATVHLLTKKQTTVLSYCKKPLRYMKMIHLRFCKSVLWKKQNGISCLRPLT